MAQLPPKIPATISHNWPSPAMFGHQKPPSTLPSFFAAAANPAPTSNNPSWVDEFLDFSAARRGAHRRSVSGPVAFIEAPTVDQFDRLDDEQLMSMFSDDVPPSPSRPVQLGSSSPSSPSDHNSIYDEKPEAKAERNGSNEAEEAQSECKLREMLQTAIETKSEMPSSETTIIMDPKRVKR